MAEFIADRVTWDDGTEYMNVADVARLLAEREADAYQQGRADLAAKVEALRDEWWSEPDGSALLNAQAAARLMHILAAAATPAEPLIVDGDAAYLTPDADHG